jgi:hypothetical protein
MTSLRQKAIIMAIMGGKIEYQCIHEPYLDDTFFIRV